MKTIILFIKKIIHNNVQKLKGESFEVTVHTAKERVTWSKFRHANCVIIAGLRYCMQDLRLQ